MPNSSIIATLLEKKNTRAMLLLNWCLAVSKSKGSNMHGTTDSLTYHMIRNLLMQKFVFAETSDIMVIQSMQKIRHSIIPVTKAWWAPVMRKEFPFQGIVIKRCQASLPSLIYMYAAVCVFVLVIKKRIVNNIYPYNDFIQIMNV